MVVYQSSEFPTATGYTRSVESIRSLGALQLGYFGLGLGTALVLTTSSMTVPTAQSTALIARQTTNSGGLSIDVVQAPYKAVMELRRRSGLTWDQLGQIFGVTRRTMHFWASGQPLATENERALNAVLAFVRAYDRGAANLNRDVILQNIEGRTTLELLRDGHYGQAGQRFSGPTSAVPLSQAKSDLAGKVHPLPAASHVALNIILDGRQDRVSMDNPKRRAVAPIKKRKTT